MMESRQVLVVCMLLLARFGATAELDPEPSIPSLHPPSQGIDLRTLIGEVGTRTHKRFVVDPRVAQAVVLEGLEHQNVTYPQLLSVLQVYGATIVPGDGILEAVPNIDGRTAALPLVGPDNIKTLDDELITCVIPVKNISAAQLVPILRPLIPQYGHLAAFPDRNALTMVDRTANVRRLIGIIRIYESLPKTPEMPSPKNGDKP